jgi:hypothetical protein
VRWPPGGGRGVVPGRGRTVFVPALLAGSLPVAAPLLFLAAAALGGTDPRDVASAIASERALVRTTGTDNDYHER